MDRSAEPERMYVPGEAEYARAWTGPLSFYLLVYLVVVVGHVMSCQTDIGYQRGICLELVGE